ncbi:hypothetical protein BDN72DRAFT_876563 [Pluteus cervinus]|uniref:Uncharacterized protein n=1 Tax=Pluteus cervinus TaxID=181527 RepID=A0ACD3B365_9AGAR|nr:hypothetical protein BDN72DRAFT_876563 [Pluteus cervinus]
MSRTIPTGNPSPDIPLTPIQYADLVEQERIRLDTEVVELDARIAELLLARAALMKRRNMLAPVSRLSQDVLQSIFEGVQTAEATLDADYEDLEDGFPVLYTKLKQPESQLSWVKALTHVCSNWRELALSTPTLWCDILPHEPELALEMLTRSRSTPLSISIRETGVLIRHSAFLREVLRKHVNRTRLLKVYLPSYLYQGVINEPLRSYVPLHTLGSCSFNTHTLAAGSQGIDLPISFLINIAHSLRHLSLDLCVFPLKTFNTSVSFSCLSNLRIRSRPTRCAEFLDLVSLPPTSSVCISTWDERSDYSDLCPFVRRFWEGPDRELNSLVIGRLDADVYVSDLRMTFTDKDRTKGTLKIQIEGDPLSLQRSLMIPLLAFGYSVPVGHLTHLTAHCAQLDHGFWSFVGNSCHEMTDLRICVEDVGSFLAVLHIGDQVPTLGMGTGLILDPSVGEAAFTTPVRLPKLIHMTFTAMDVSEVDLWTLEECLIIRGLVGKAVHSVTFDFVDGIDADQAQALGRYVKDKASWLYNLEGSL